MPEVTFEEAQRQISRLTTAARDAEKAARFDDAVAQWRAVLAHPCAHHLVDDHGVLDQIHHDLRRAGRWDDAIAAKREAIDAGYRSEPDPESSRCGTRWTDRSGSRGMPAVSPPGPAARTTRA